jgi:hypothetical protein
MNTRTFQARRLSTQARLSTLLLAILIAAGCKSSAAPPQPASSDPAAAATAPADPQVSSKNSAKSGSLQHISLNDPMFNMSSGTLAFFAGWTGTAAIDRSDPYGPQDADIVFRLTSPDGNSLIQQLNQPLHTGLFRIPVQGGHFALTRFTSTADLLTRYVLPSLKLGGQASPPQPFAPAFLANIRRQGEASGVPGVIGDTAGILVSGADPGKEYFVWGITRGTLQGTQAENTTTYIGVVEAPIGQARSLAESFKAIPLDPPNQQWAALDQQHRQQIAANSQASANASNQAVQQSINNLNAATARNAANSNATREQIDQQGQAARAVLHAGVVAGIGTGSTHQWCNTVTNEQRTVYNSLNPPDSGSWKHCD